MRYTCCLLCADEVLRFPRTLYIGTLDGSTWDLAATRCGRVMSIWSTKVEEIRTVRSEGRISVRSPEHPRSSISIWGSWGQ